VFLAGKHKKHKKQQAQKAQKAAAAHILHHPSLTIPPQTTSHHQDPYSLTSSMDNVVSMQTLWQKF
jgi:hypothetical protein